MNEEKKNPELEKTNLEIKISEILLLDKIFREEILNNLASLTEIKKDNFIKNQERILSLQNLLKDYKKFLPEKDNPLLLNIQKIIQKAEKEINIMKMPIFEERINFLNSKMHYAKFGEAEVFF